MTFKLCSCLLQRILTRVSFNKTSTKRGSMSVQKHSSRVHVFQYFPALSYRKQCFERQFLFPRCKLCSHYRVENLNENPSMRAIAKSLRARASEHSSKFTSNPSKGQISSNFVSTFKVNGTISYPFYSYVCSRILLRSVLGWEIWNFQILEVCLQDSEISHFVSWSSWKTLYL